MRADLFRLENVEVRAVLYPPAGESYPSGTFTRLFATINADDSFTHWYQEKGHRATFESNVLRMEVDTRSVEIDADLTTFPTFPIVRDQVCALAGSVGEVLGVDFVLPTRFFIWGVWPLEPGIEERDIGSILKTQALQLTDGHYHLLPGTVAGAAIELVGNDARMNWTVKVAPYLPEPDHLYLSAELRFFPPDDPPQDHSELIKEGMDATYDFVTQKVVPFAGSFMP